ncbi:hypothetical protein GIS00_20190 [Nakamurella sp. YIM 132087]|uniref:Alpha/beta-hydrolase family protein n=1 Tax=Nakamurella alba TaxID=2665158 RepID=A0A7K1FSW1_9ACTN|nr:alpha/beta-hydrolase family protein [Nakamurella alba]MTD16263.1 hypothetical protein [Nakamurella alba]
MGIPGQLLVLLRAHAGRFWRELSVGGVAGALTFFCFSMTPSLLPREWYLQGVASGICTVLGYAVGTFLGALVRRLGFRGLHHARHRVIANRVLLGLAIVLIPLFGVLGARWQLQVRELVRADTDDPNYYALVLLIAFVLARILLALARFLRWSARALGRFGGRWIPVPIAKAVAAVLVTVAVVLLLTDTLGPALLRAANNSFSLTDQGTADGVQQPTDPDRSGSPASLVSWDDLGREGRSFVATGPSTADISAFTGAPALAPVRVYAGLESADGLQQQADLVVRELQRTGGFDRSVLVVATSTGRGWINQVAAAALEYMWGGDTAIAGMQYSTMPSPVAFVVDTATPPQAGRILFDAVHAVWQTLPVDDRPRLITMGESLGSFGSQGAFDGLADVTAESDGSVWAGTPSFTPLWERATADRDPGSPEQVPVLDDCAVVCFSAAQGDIPAEATPKVVYLQHVNDPVVWWSGDLLFNRPDWLDETPQEGRSTTMTWIPLVTFWQVTTDMVFSSAMPDGYGHHYALELVDAFGAVVPPDGWSAGEAERLRQVLSSVGTGG